MSRGTPIALALLAGYALAFASAALGTSPLLHDDHPGQLYRVWHVALRGPAPWAWDPGWWAGYPELQFYPPGFAYAAVLLRSASFDMLSVAGAYHALVWIAYLAPGFTTLFALARLLGSGWAALPGAFVALTLSAGVASGVEGGVHAGMLAARLAWALLPLLVLALSRWANAGGPFPAVSVAIVAGIVLTHPAHLPAALAIVFLAALASPPRGRRLRAAVVALAVAAALTAFWTGPLLWRLAHTRALAWGSLTARDVVASLGANPLLILLIVLGLLATRLAARPMETVVARLPWVMAAVVMVDRLGLEPLGVSWLPADRVIDGAWLALVLAAGLAVGRLLTRWQPGGAAARTGLALASVVAIALVSLVGGSLTLWPRAAEWPAPATIERGLRLDALWARLRAGPPGRVLFVRSAVPLRHGTEWYRPHTHVTAMTPILAGRQIVHGTFTHPSPIAALVYKGSAGPGPITSLAEKLDGHTLFGRPLAFLDTATLVTYADRLGIATIVALEDDVPSLPALSDAGAFEAARPSPPFAVYVRRSPPTIPLEITPQRWRLDLDPGRLGWVSTRIAYYPLWRANARGQPLPTRRGEIGDLEVLVTASDSSIDLTYTPALPEIAALTLSALTAAACLTHLGHRTLRRR